MSQLDTGGEGPIEDRELSKEAIVDLLEDETDEGGDKKDKPDVLDIKVDDDKEDEEKEDKQEEGQEKEEKEDDIRLAGEEDDPADEKLEVRTPPRRSEILKDFPDLFKKHPYLETAYYREQKFTELFGTIDDAEAVKERAEAVDDIEHELMQGNTEPILKAIKEQDPDAFKKVADDYMQTLANVDSDAYYHVTGNVIKRTVMAMAEHAKGLSKEDNEQMLGAAHMAYTFVFGPGAKFSPPVNLFKGGSDDGNKEKNELDEQKREFAIERFETAREDLSGRLERTLKATIDENMDPRDQMSSYIKEHATTEALADLQQLIESDTRFMRAFDGLWEQALESGYNRPSINKLRSAFTSKAKTLLPSVIKKSRRKALQGLGQRTVSSKRDESDSGRSTRPGRVSKDRSSQKPSHDGTGMRTEDFFNQD